LTDKVEASLPHDHLRPKGYLVRAKADTIRLAATQLIAAGREGTGSDGMGELLLGAPRQGRDRKPRGDERGKGFPGGEIYQAFRASVTGSPP
jgi:hypothetical protein